MQKRHIKHPFGPVITKKARILILGSVPSLKSVEHGFYYMHPQNRFWKVLGELLGEEMYSLPVPARIEILNRRGIALYDSVEECDIEGSSDSAISSIVPADIPALMRGTQIRHIFCNGAASYQSAVKYHPELAPITQKLPSTSPANAAYSLQKLCDEWRTILEWL